MLYSDIKRAVLSHINQYSIAGAQVALTYNNQADYVNRIPQLINEALVNIRTSVKPLPTIVEIGLIFDEDDTPIPPENQGRPIAEAALTDESDRDPVKYDQAIIYAKQYGSSKQYRAKLPDDFWCLKSGGVEAIDDQGHHFKTNRYRLQGRDFILFPDKRIHIVEYFRYPEQLPNDPKDSFDLQEDIDVIHAAIYYAAANLVLYDDQFAYASLYNDYESRLSRLSPGVAMEVHPVVDYYGFYGGGDY
jgi:hypothetical protein